MRIDLCCIDFLEEANMVNRQKRNSVDVRPTDVGWKDKRSICPGQRCACNSPLQPPCVGQRSPTVQMTPSLFQLNNFHTPFPISSLPAGDSKCGCVPRPKQQQNVRWLTTVCQSGHSADQTGTSATVSKSVLPERVRLVRTCFIC